MHEVLPLIRPAIKDEDPNREHAVWFLLDEVNGKYKDDTGVSKSLHWLRNHLQITNVDHEEVVPIMVTRAEYQAYFSPDAKEWPEEGIYKFLSTRYEAQKPEAMKFGEAKKATVHKRAVYHPATRKASAAGTQEYKPQEGQGDEAM